MGDTDRSIYVTSQQNVQKATERQKMYKQSQKDKQIILKQSSFISERKDGQQMAENSLQQYPLFIFQFVICITSIQLNFNQLIQLPNNNFLSIMLTIQMSNNSISENQRFSPYFLATIQQFRKQEEYLIENLQYALHLNKQLILTSLFSCYFSPFHIPSNGLIHQPYQNPKELSENNSDRSVDRKNQRWKLKLRIKKKRQSYDTKNIPKNFGTAIHIFIKRNSAKVKILLAKKKVSYSQFYQFNKDAKQKINSLLHLRELWQPRQGDNEGKLKECYRIISYQFMRRHCLSYIFGSRIKNTSSHIRYRKKLLQGIERPQALFNLKDY